MGLPAIVCGMLAVTISPLAVVSNKPIEDGTMQDIRRTKHLQSAGSEAVEPKASHPYVGMWKTADGHVRHNLLPGNRYDEARGTRESAYRGRYEVTGDHIEYWDDTGFTADGDFVNGVLHHGGMILYRDGVGN
jgi:hypothetical protein